MTRRFVVGLAFLFATGCGGESSSDGASGGGAGTGGSATGGSGGSGGSATGGSGGTSTGGAAGSGGSAGSSCGDSVTTACAKPSECELMTQNCCLCGMPEITDFTAINTAYQTTCSCQGPVCACAVGINPNLAASCEAGSCRGWDVRQREDFSGCQKDEDCRLRNGLECCEPCSGEAFQLVAIQSTADAALKAAVCDGGEACSKCLPLYPTDKAAKCVANRCQVVDVDAGGP